MAVESRGVVRVGPDGRATDRDPVVVEAPLELRDAAGAPLTVTMRTPGDDDDLVRGLLFAEGAFDDPAAAAGLGLSRPPGSAPLSPAERDNVVVVGGLDPAELGRRLSPRALPATSACGVCGAASIAALELRAGPVASDLVADPGVIADLPGRLRAAQTVFAATGGLHGAGLFTASGQLIAVREDIGRHNAVDKLVGWALAAGRVPLADCILGVSGRLGFEIAHKAVVAGVPLVVAAKAPSSLAIDVAERFRVTLCGFTRGGRFNIYSHAARVVGPAPRRPAGT